MKLPRIGLTWSAAIAAALLSVPALAVTLTHDYTLQNTLSDSLGGPALVNNGGTLTASGLMFGPGQGPSVVSALNSDTYTIDMQFHFDDVTGYRRVLDFKDRSSDRGLYIHDGQLVFYPGQLTSSPVIGAGENLDVLVSRNGANGNFVGFVNGTEQVAFNDAGGNAIFDGTGNIAYFFKDDTVHGGEESGGVVTEIKLYSGALDATNSGCTSTGGGAVPEPANVLLVGLSLLGIVGRSSWRRRA